MSAFTDMMGRLRDAAELYDHMVEPKTAILLLEAANAIDGLESLVRDMWVYLSDPGTESPCSIPVLDMMRERMRELGIEVER